MNRQSSATYVAYGLRPAKQAERRLLLDFLKCVNEAGHGVSDSRYVGMGGTLFYDFHLMHRFAGINRMVSLERNPDIFPRCDFNCPFDFIDVLNLGTADFLSNDRDERKTIYWFDYDGAFGPDIIADIFALGTRVKLGGFAFVTVYASPAGARVKEKVDQRLEYFQEEFGEFAVGLTTADMQNSAFPKTVGRILLAAFAHAFAPRGDGKFYPLFRVLYSDTTQMITIGGFFCSENNLQAIKSRLKIDLPFLLTEDPYKIRNLNLTERERALFDRAVTANRANSKQANSLRTLGFDDLDFKAYRELIRFLPRYHEAII